MTGFMGMGMAMNAAGGGMNAQNLFVMGQQQQAQQAAQQQPAPQVSPAADGWKCACGTTVTGNFCPNCGAKKPEPKPAPGAWKCSCGATVTGNFCPECGSKRPAEDEGWTCSCGAVNKGKFCTNCGAKKPAGHRFTVVISADGNRKIRRIRQDSVRSVEISLTRTTDSNG